MGYGQVAAAVAVGEGFGILRETRLAYHINVAHHENTAYTLLL